MFLPPSNRQTTEDDKVILLKYIWKLFFDFAQDQQASSFPVDLFLNTIRIFLWSNMSIPISLGTSHDTTSIENSWLPSTFFVLPMYGQGLPSPNIYECVDLLRLSGFPPKLINALSPIHDRCAPVSIIHLKPLGLLVWKLTDV